jgi:hypothetical protein
MLGIQNPYTAYTIANVTSYPTKVVVDIAFTVAKTTGFPSRHVCFDMLVHCVSEYLRF